MARKIGKKVYTEYRLGFEAIVAKLGGLPLRDSEYELNTKFGRLFLKCYADKEEMWIHTRFDEEKRPKGLMDYNPFSGKWNMHINYLPQIEANLLSVMPEKAVQAPSQELSENTLTAIANTVVLTTQMTHQKVDLAS